MSIAVLVLQLAESAALSAASHSLIAPTVRIAQLAANPPLAVFTIIPPDGNSVIHLLSQLALRDDIETAHLFINGDAFTFGDRESAEIVPYSPPQ